MITKFKLFENKDNDKYELIGSSLEDILDAISKLKDIYHNIKIIDKSGHKSDKKFM